MATLVAVVCLLVILSLTTVAVEQSVGGLSSFAQGRKLLQTVDAAETGVQSEISSMEQWLSSPTLTVPCAGGSSVSGLPGGQGWIPAGASSSDTVVNGASLGFYSLSVAAYTSEPSGSPEPLPASDACYGHTFLAPVTTPWYLLVQSRGVSSATTGGTKATGRTLQALLLVNEGSLAADHHRHNPSSGHVRLIAFYASGATTYTSTATAQAVNFSPLSTTASTASYTGPGPPDANVVSDSQPPTTPFTTESWLTLGALSQYAEADSSGSSLACSGLVASPGTIGLGSPTCTPSGSPSPTGVKLDLSTIPAVGSLISPIADVTLEMSAVTSSASMGSNGSPVSGSASLGTVYVRVTVPLGSPVIIPVTLASGPNQDMLTAITNAISGDAPAIGTVTPSLVAALESTFTITSNYQKSSGGTFTASAIHLTIPSAAVTADLAMSQVGPNPATTTTSPTTISPTTTVAPPPPSNLTVVWIKQVP